MALIAMEPVVRRSWRINYMTMCAIYIVFLVRPWFFLVVRRLLADSHVREGRFSFTTETLLERNGGGTPPRGSSSGAFLCGGG